MNFIAKNSNNYSIIVSNTDKLNGSNADELKKEINQINNNHINNIIIDLTATSYCDSSGLSALLLANRLCKKSSGNFVLVGLQPMVKKVIEIAQLHRVLEITETLEEAQQKIN